LIKYPQIGPELRAKYEGDILTVQEYKSTVYLVSIMILVIIWVEGNNFNEN